MNFMASYNQGAEYVLEKKGCLGRLLELLYAEVRNAT